MKFARVKLVTKTRHFENETLYWTKAASVLGLPQLQMVDSEVPIPPAKAKADLIALLADNLDDYSPPSDDKEMIMDGWRRLCERYTPIFFEKSPHHLPQWSVLELILECRKELADIDFLFIGLVRNPMDTIYSQFTRWAARPEPLQQQWLVAYRNLVRLKALLQEQLVIIRYEDMVSSLGCLQPVFDFCGVNRDEIDPNYLHRASLAKWKSDRFFSFSLAEEVVALAQTYGYRKEELTNSRALFWPVYRELVRFAKKSKKSVLKVAR